MRVALVVMPFAAIDRPCIGTGLLQAALARRGIACTTKYFNVTLARLMGVDGYHEVACDGSTTALGCEWAFSQAYFGQRLSNWEAYRREVLDVPVWGLNAAGARRIEELMDLIPAFLRVAIEADDWGSYDLVGFTSTFEQTMASMCLARLIRSRYPSVKIAVGGGNFEGDMGRPYMKHFPFLDYVSTGEADESFPALCENLRDGRAEVPAGFLYREGGAIHGSTGSAGGALTALDDLPTPDYGDFFRVLEATIREHRPPICLPVEASRGCWWGEISHCTFCGQNGGTMAFRRKSAGRVIEETDALAARYGPLPLLFTDNILSMSYFEDVLPAWAARERRDSKLFEIKANLRRSQVKLLHDAGVTNVQPGIESLADATLQVMGKGVTAAQNVALLRWCTEHGIEARWNLIFGFPREDPDDYARNLAVMERITHLPPPFSCSPIRLDRLSPNHLRYREQGFTRIEPLPAYRHVFPFSEAEREEAAYFFLYDHPRYDDVLRRGYDLVAFRRRWAEERANGRAGELSVTPAGGGYALVDTRWNHAPRTRPLDAAEVAALLACDAPAPRPAAIRRAIKAYGADAAAVEARLGRLLDDGVIAEMGSRLVTLALLPVDRPMGRPAPGELAIAEEG